MPDYSTTLQAAARWGITPQRVRQLCAAGRVPGSLRHGRDWFIPADAPKPEKRKPGRKTLA